MTRAPAVKKHKVNPGLPDPRVARVLAHAEAIREAWQVIDLPNDLRDLSGINLSGANLSYIWLNGADLRDADLRRADLIRANLSGADLTGAILFRAEIRFAPLNGAKLSGANLYGADLYGAKLNGADLTRADLTRADLGLADLSGADLSGADLSGADLSEANLSDANLRGANLTGADLTVANFRGADLRGAKLNGADLTRADLGAADLSNADLTDADLSGAYLTKTKLTGVDLSKAKNIPRTGALKEQYKIRSPSSAAFTRWFGQSVVVGDKKKPVVVYHGTSKGGFTAFDPNAKDAHHNAFYFTDNAEVAETYTDMTLPQERPDPALTNDAVGIYRLYIRLVNPMIVEGGGEVWDNLSDPRTPGLYRTWEIATWAEKNGHDGVIFKDIVDGGEQSARDAVAATVYAVFDPRAIKSATANNGNYDPNDPDIRHNPLIKPNEYRSNSWHRRNR